MGEVAKWFAEVEPTFPASYFRRQLTYYVQVGLIRPPVYRGTSIKSAGLLGQYEICAAYLLSNLTRLGLPAETLKYVERYFNYISIRRRGQEKVFGSLREVIRATQDDGTWYLLVKVKDWSRSEDWERPSVIAEFQERPDVGADAAENRAVIVLDCRHLLRPLLDVLRRQDGAAQEDELELAS